MQQSAETERSNGQNEEQVEHVLPLGEETLKVDKRQVEGHKTTIRRFVLQRPATADVELHSETVVVEAREPVDINAKGDVLSESTYDAHDTVEEPVVSKEVRIVQEVVVRRIKSVRIETINETVRYDEVKIERDGEEQQLDSDAQQQSAAQG